MFCPQCGASNADTAAVCTQCGRQLQAGIRALGVAIVLFGILRNLPVHPFNLLAPGVLLPL